MRCPAVAAGSLLYGFVLIVLHVLRELLRVQLLQQHSSNLFSLYKYAAGCLFLVELGVLRLYETRWHRQTARGDHGVIATITTTSGGGPTNYYVGSFYIRMGILVFGSVAVVQHLMRGLVELIARVDIHHGGKTEDFNATTVEMEYSFIWAKELLIANFIMLEMMLIFNFSISHIRRQNTLECYGFMHLLVVDVLKWVRYAIGEYNHLLSQNNDDRQMAADSAGPRMDLRGFGEDESDAVDDQVFGEYSSVVDAFNTEFLIVAAGVSFIVWLNLSQLADKTDWRWEAAIEGGERRKKTIRITIGRHFTGLFLGVLLSIFMTLAILYHSYERSHQHLRHGMWTIEIANGVTYLAMLSACLTGLVVMRRTLSGKWDLGLGEGAKDQLLDNLLLFVGVAAEVLYCGAAILGNIYGDSPLSDISILSFVGFLLRLAQVFLQLHLIMDLNGAHHSGGRTPGRQTILFLLWANLSLFFYYCVQTIHSVFTTTVIGQMPFPYKPVIALALPFVLFYRFHSSAVLADIYKHHCGEPNAAKKHQRGYSPNRQRKNRH